MPDKTLYTVQCARGVAAFMVVAFHMLSIEAKYVYPAVLPSFFGIGECGVDIFFVISGFVMLVTTARLPLNRRAAFDFLCRRFKRIYPLYWFFTLMLLPVYLLAPQLVNTSQNNHADLLRSFLLLPGEHLPLLAVAWSLVFEIWFYVVFSALLLLPRRALPAMLGTWGGALFIAWLVTPRFESTTLNFVSNPYALEFIAGCAGYYLYRDASIRAARFAAASGISILLALLIFWPEFVQTPSLGKCVALGISVSLTLYGVAALERHGCCKAAGLLKWTGDISYAVYLSHILVLSLLGRVFLAFTKRTDGSLFDATLIWIAGFLRGRAFDAPEGHGFLALPALCLRPVAGIDNRPHGGIALHPQFRSAWKEGVAKLALENSFDRLRQTVSGHAFKRQEVGLLIELCRAAGAGWQRLEQTEAADYLGWRCRRIDILGIRQKHHRVPVVKDRQKPPRLRFEGHPAATCGGAGASRVNIPASL